MRAEFNARENSIAFLEEGKRQEGKWIFGADRGLLSRGEWEREC